MNTWLFLPSTFLPPDSDLGMARVTWAPPLGMKTAFVRHAPRIAELLVIDMEVEIRHVLHSVIGQGDTRSISKWHLEVTVHGAILHGDGQGPPGWVFLAAMCAGNIFVLEPGSEEISDRNFHARLGFAIPVHPEHQLAQMKGTGRVDGEPNMPDGACPVYIRELDRGLGLHFDPVRIAAGAVGT